ncbi:MAG: hypothetical protein L0H79_08040 [Intrasporangium sp.]|uniref:hypothetical protein n=1 Tax=Intrasporangium sp. TaxID=1925024 RepID=UPI0026487C98|nr:hypothetical protein [Intrasporangium sp.]MDN5795687.1 hypothetical protein [Intrasporangium sp.]
MRHLRVTLSILLVVPVAAAVIWVLASLLVRPSTPDLGPAVLVQPTVPATPSTRPTTSAPPTAPARPSTGTATAKPAAPPSRAPQPAKPPRQAPGAVPANPTIACPAGQDSDPDDDADDVDDDPCDD